MKSKFTPETRQKLVAFASEGLSIRDAARSADVRDKTVRGWLSKGRAEASGPYADFAGAFDDARMSFAEQELPMTRDELVLQISRAAKRGSVQAQKLYWEVLQTEKQSNAPDPFAELDSWMGRP